MSIALDSPMEALAIHGVLTAVNNVWAWIAFLTAAISFWKIKTSIHFPPHHLSLQLSPPPSDQPETFPVTEPELASTSTPTTLSLTPSKRLATFCTLENRKSGKFSVYFAQDDKIDVEEDIHSFRKVKEDEKQMDSIQVNGEEDVRMMSSVRRNRGEEGWKVAMKMKTSEMGWYSYQDLTVLDGNVVQLWN